MAKLKTLDGSNASKETKEVSWRRFWVLGSAYCYGNDLLGGGVLIGSLILLSFLWYCLDTMAAA